jgi:hypothetical protein
MILGSKKETRAARIVLSASQNRKTDNGLLVLSRGIKIPEKKKVQILELDNWHQFSPQGLFLTELQRARW